MVQCVLVGTMPKQHYGKQLVKFWQEIFSGRQYLPMKAGNEKPRQGNRPKLVDGFRGRHPIRCLGLL